MMKFLNKMNKYFTFTGTISGTNYFLRNLLSTLGAVIGGFSIGWGIGTGTMFVLLLGILIMTPSIWFNACTIYKRSNALFPQYATLITVLMFLLQIVGELNPLFSILVFITGMVLLFKNSDIENHEG